MKIAISGKGGVGKTTVAANLVYCFSTRNIPVFAIDADPDANLGHALGLDATRLSRVKPLIKLKEVIDAKNAGGGTLVDLNPDVDDVLDKYTLREGLVRFLRMGAVKQGGSACYCKENSFLNAVLTTVLLDRPEAVVLDMSAGIEHLTRGTARGVEMMLVVVEPGRASVSTALAVDRLARDLEVPRVVFVGNKIRDKADADFLDASLPKERILGMLAFSSKVLERARRLDIAAFSRDDLLPGMEKVCDYIIGGGSF